ncbi:hypothetical protein NA78x_001153 [Anatilimnocola sp. NA78]|uniref:hypothetical protein n=1 Tax=Anatilimnocola sp. NA78 TaxID=3415683 RepID=UPI003CE5991C
MRHGANLLWLVIALVVTNAPLRADLPLPPNEEYIKPRMQFTGIETYPEYVFQLRHQSSAGNPTSGVHKYEAVRNDTPFTLDVERRIGDFQLLAMKRDAFEKRAQADPSLQWLTSETDGVLAADVDEPSVIGEKYRRLEVINVSRVEVKDGKLVVTTEPLKSEVRIPGITWWINVGLAILLAAGMVALGLRLARPGRARPRIRTAFEQSSIQKNRDLGEQS